MKMTPLLCALLMTTLVIGPAFGGTFTPPQGCMLNMTVQSRGCYAANFFTCEADPAGDRWRADFDQEGMFYMSRIDNETQWVESRELFPTVIQTLDPNPKDPANFSSLLSTGRDDFDFSLSKDNGEHTNVAGFDELTGRSVTIDGITLQETAYSYQETDDAGTILRQSRGHEYISAEQRQFFSGRSEWFDGTEWLEVDGSPVKFILPDEKGFGATQPIFDCDTVTSDLSPPASLQSRQILPVRFAP
jgi:hypothetical protein